MLTETKIKRKLIVPELKKNKKIDINNVNKLFYNADI